MAATKAGAPGAATKAGAATCDRKGTALKKAALEKAAPKKAGAVYISMSAEIYEARDRGGPTANSS